MSVDNEYDPLATSEAEPKPADTVEDEAEDEEAEDETENEEAENEE